VLGKADPTQPWMPHFIRPNANAEQHNSLRGAWWILEYLPHRYVDLRSGSRVVRWRIPRGRPRYIPKKSTIYELAKPHVGVWDDTFEIEHAVTFPPYLPVRRDDAP